MIIFVLFFLPYLWEKVIRPNFFFKWRFLQPKFSKQSSKIRVFHTSQDIHRMWKTHGLVLGCVRKPAKTSKSDHIFGFQISVLQYAAKILFIQLFFCIFCHQGIYLWWFQTQKWVFMRKDTSNSFGLKWSQELRVPHISYFLYLFIVFLKSIHIFLFRYNLAIW